jgi:predicted TIM-barrel fold metal-dependent hydrolase
VKVFDCHVHVAPWTQMPAAAQALFSRHWSEKEKLTRTLSSPSGFLALMDEQGIERAALVNYPAPDVMGFDVSVNAWVTDFVRGNEDRLVAVGSVHPRLTRDAAGDTARLFENGVRMLKVHPPHQLYAANEYLEGDVELEAIYRTAEQYGRPVMIHTGTSVFPRARNRFADPMAADDVAIDFPKLTILLAHAGRPLYMETAVFLARRHKNVHLELSGIPPKKLLEYLPRLEELSDKCIWGTDFPSPGVASMKKNVDDFLSLPVSEAAKEKILWGNGTLIVR